jgi:hypothetical protein
VVCTEIAAAGRKLYEKLCPSATKGAEWANLGCDIAVADLVDAGALTKAFGGTEGVFAMLPPVFDPAPGFPEAREFNASMYMKHDHDVRSMTIAMP